MMGEELTAGLNALLASVRTERRFNLAKGDSAYRQGMDDGLHFVEDALEALLRSHGIDAAPADVDGLANAPGGL
ncbi:MAG: hypothetical protein ACYDAG_16550 [Chloroflexota bacterium]